MSVAPVYLLSLKKKHSFKNLNKFKQIIGTGLLKDKYCMPLLPSHTLLETAAKGLPLRLVYSRQDLGECLFKWCLITYLLFSDR